MRTMTPMASTKWTRTTLDKLCSGRGKSIEAAKYPERRFELYSVPSFPAGKPEDVCGKEIGSNKQIVEPESVLLCKINPRINRAWVVGEFTAHEKIASTEWIVFPPTKGIRPKFLCYYLQQDTVRDFLATNASGVGGSLMRVKPTTLKGFPFSYPNSNEQDQIIAEIEKQFARLDAGIAALKKTQANLKRYRAAVLKAACEGVLLPNKFASWCRATLGDVLIGIEAGKSFKCEERPPTSKEVGIVKVSAVTWGVYNELESKTCMDLSRIEERYFVRPGDFLFSRANTIELVGACVIAKNVALRVMLSDKILRFRFSPEVIPEWVLYWLRSETGRNEIVRLATGNQESMRNIGQERIRQITLSVPPLVEQQLIVAEIERRLSVVTELESVVSANLQRSIGLRRSILQQSFSEK